MSIDQIRQRGDRDEEGRSLSKFFNSIMFNRLTFECRYLELFFLENVADWYSVSKTANICLHIESSNVQFVN